MINGNALSKLRQLKGIKQQQLAKKIGISQQALSKLEQREKINKEKFEAILAALKISAVEWEQIQKLLPPPHIMRNN
ncbi:MAG: helix-turn-helix transcriptional regulator [Sphingobacteriales bacterium]|nr:helix-turn-helix transcriptional regulator [Sphingobacteriales bacterium]